MTLFERIEDDGPTLERVSPQDVADALGAELIPQTEAMAINLFLSRWCHRAMGDRAMAEQELRELIARRRQVSED